MKILIPTYLERSQVADLISEIEANSPGHEVFASCTKASASVNRNLCLDQIEVGETAIMLDDDISGFCPGWVEHLLAGLTLPNAVMVSARLLKPDGKTFGITCSDCYDPTPDEIPVKGGKTSILPTAAVAFVHAGHRLDEKFIGSGYEDSDWCFQYRKSNPAAVFVQSNRCRLIHLNERKEGRGANWDHNKKYFHKKWGIR